MPRFANESARRLFQQMTSGMAVLPQSVSNELNEIVFHVAEGCNLGCTYCFADMGQYGAPVAKWMDPEDAATYARSMCEQYDSIEVVKFFGGEPMMNVPAIRAAIQAFDQCFDHGMLPQRPLYGAVSNMTVTSPAVLDLVGAYDMQVTGSIDGPPDVHDRFRVFNNGRGSFDAVDRGITKMLATVGQPTALECVYGPQHVAAGYSIIDTYEFLRERYGIDTIVIHPMVREPLVADLPGWDDYYAQLRELSSEYARYVVSNTNDPVHAHNVRREVKKLRLKTSVDAHCDLGLKTKTVTADGELYPCYTLIGHEEWKMSSDVTRPVTSDDGHDRIQLRLIDNTKSGNPVCRNCDVVSVCHACPGSMLQVGGTIDAPERSHCLDLIGHVEGTLAALMEVRNDPERWPAVQRVLATTDR